MECIGIGRHSGATVCWLRRFLTRLARIYGDYVIYIIYNYIYRWVYGLLHILEDSINIKIYKKKNILQTATAELRIEFPNYRIYI